MEETVKKRRNKVKQSEINETINSIDHFDRSFDGVVNLDAQSDFDDDNDVLQSIPEAARKGSNRKLG